MLKVRRWKRHTTNTQYELRKFFMKFILEADGLSKIDNLKKRDNGKFFLPREFVCLACMSTNTCHLQ